MTIDPNAPNSGSADNDFDRTPGSPKPPSTKRSPIGIYVLVLLLVGGIAFALYWFLSGSSGSIDAEMLAYLPADSNVMAGADLEALNKNAKLKELIGKVDPKEDPLKEFNDKLKDVGLTIDDFSRVLMGGVVDKDRPTVVWRTKKSFDKPKMAAILGYSKEEKKGDKTYYSSQWQGIVYFPTDTLIVQTSSKHFETLSGKESSKIVVSEELQEFAKKMSKGDAWVAVAREAVPDKDLKGIDLLKEMKLPYVSAELLDAAKGAKFAGLSVKVSDDKLTASGSLMCADKEQAEKAETALKKDIADWAAKDLAADEKLAFLIKMMPPEIKKFADDVRKTLSVDRSGSQLTLSGNCSINDVIALLKAIKDRDEKEAEEQRRRPVPKTDDRVQPPIKKNEKAQPPPIVKPAEKKPPPNDDSDKK